MYNSPSNVGTFAFENFVFRFCDSISSGSSKTSIDAIMGAGIQRIIHSSTTTLSPPTTHQITPLSPPTTHQIPPLSHLLSPPLSRPLPPSPHIPPSSHIKRHNPHPLKPPIPLRSLQIPNFTLWNL
ncbi:hypothetical protein M7I_2380 [Glarea lozoyensis 74030]|uniref:Uncharacterized protein n=1 Tax=Glarea lozoyensis (strain ATCC 74030 / MF5533) TaxID=1104152 RepID=H0EIM0_GLAL7|nr:hypothetical protein M7I_2380 [Glarea lozoyensis 74030]